MTFILSAIALILLPNAHADLTEYQAKKCHAGDPLCIQAKETKPSLNPHFVPSLRKTKIKHQPIGFNSAENTTDERVLAQIQHHTSFDCYDRILRPIILAEESIENIQKAYRKTLECMNPCYSKEDLDFLVSCANWNVFQDNNESLEETPKLSCDKEQILKAAGEQRFLNWQPDPKTKECVAMFLQRGGLEKTVENYYASTPQKPLKNLEIDRIQNAFQESKTKAKEPLAEPDQNEFCRSNIGTETPEVVAKKYEDWDDEAKEKCSWMVNGKLLTDENKATHTQMVAKWLSQRLSGKKRVALSQDEISFIAIHLTNWEVTEASLAGKISHQEFFSLFAQFTTATGLARMMKVIDIQKGPWINLLISYLDETDFPLVKSWKKSPDAEGFYGFFSALTQFKKKQPLVWQCQDSEHLYLTVRKQKMGHIIKKYPHLGNAMLLLGDKANLDHAIRCRVQ